MDNEFKVLVCDDSFLIRKKLRESIKLCYKEAQIIDAKDGMEALYLYRIHTPELVFMDIVMPGKSGIDVVKELKELNPQIEIVMVSSVGTKVNLYKAFSAGATDFIQKPWTQASIDKIVSKYIPEPIEETPEPEPEVERISGFEIKPNIWKMPDQNKK